MTELEKVAREVINCGCCPICRSKLLAVLERMEKDGRKETA